MTASHTDLPWYDRFFGEEYLRFDEHPDTPLQVDFIQNALSLDAGATILDVGCGYGRHSLPLAEAGYCVYGLDRSPTMLAAAQRSTPAGDRRPMWIRGDMLALPLGVCVDAALSMFSSLGYFEDENENFRVIAQIGDALAPGGRLLIETVNREFVIRHSAPVQVYRPADMLLVEERSFDPVSSRSRVDVTVIENGQEKHLYHSVRLYTFTEIEMVLGAAGLITEAVWGDFRGGDYTCDTPHMIVLAEKP